MSELLIFGGTSEGRLLAEFCARKGIPAEVCVTTGYGAALLPGVQVHTGSLDCTGMKALLRGGSFRAAVDATHPYAREATRNIRTACAEEGVAYLRLVRECCTAEGDTVSDLQTLVTYLNGFSGTVLSTLGSKALPALREVQGFAERIWVRVLPAQDIPEMCRLLGFRHVIAEKPPFSVHQNIAHIRQSGAELLVTKESGSTGGYPEKLAAARECGIQTLTLLREPEEGLSLTAMKQWIRKEYL